MDYALLYVSRKNFNISPFPASWTRYSAFSVILDENLCSRANGFEKLLLEGCYISVQVNYYSTLHETGYT